MINTFTIFWGWTSSYFESLTHALGPRFADNWSNQPLWYCSVHSHLHPSPKIGRYTRKCSFIRAQVEFFFLNCCTPSAPKKEPTSHRAHFQPGPGSGTQRVWQLKIRSNHIKSWWHYDNLQPLIHITWERVETTNGASHGSWARPKRCERCGGINVERCHKMIQNASSKGIPMYLSEDSGCKPL